MKPRGVAGTVLVYKILGGASINGKNLDHLCELGDYVMKNMGTMGVSMLSCSLPGQALSHSLGPGQIEIGMGIHGEKGKDVCDWMECKQLIGKILNSLSDLEAVKTGLQDANSEWIVMINNLGCVTNLEMTLIVNEFMDQFSGKGRVVRLIVGTLMSSLDMNGISITLLRVDGPRRSEILQYIDLPVDTPNWPRVVNLENECNNLVALGKGD